MRRTSRSLLLGLLAATATPAVTYALPTVAYDNTVAAAIGSWTPDGFWPFSAFAAREWMGDEITLDGESRTIMQLSLRLSSTAPVRLDSVSLALYANDGIDAYSSPGAPGTELWRGAAANVAVSGPTTLVFDIPNVLVPKTFTWAVSADSDSAGLATFNPPQVGSSGDWFWDRDVRNGKWYRMSFKDQVWLPPDPVANFGAQVLAIPEPSVLMLLASILPLLRIRRSSRL